MLQCVAWSASAEQNGCDIKISSFRVWSKCLSVRRPPSKVAISQGLGCLKCGTVEKINTQGAQRVRFGPRGVSRGCPGGVPGVSRKHPSPARPPPAPGRRIHTHHAHHNTRTGTGMGPSARALHVLGPAADTARSKSRGVRHIGLPFCFFSYVLAFHFDPAQPSQIAFGRGWRSMHDARSTRRPSHRMAFSNFTVGRKERDVCIVSPAILAFS